jgi:hypothetical protein
VAVNLISNITVPTSYYYFLKLKNQYQRKYESLPKEKPHVKPKKRHILDERKTADEAIEVSVGSHETLSGRWIYSSVLDGGRGKCNPYTGILKFR